MLIYYAKLNMNPRKPSCCFLLIKWYLVVFNRNKRQPGLRNDLNWLNLPQNIAVNAMSKSQMSATNFLYDRITIVSSCDKLSAVLLPVLFCSTSECAVWRCVQLINWTCRDCVKWQICSDYYYSSNNQWLLHVSSWFSFDYINCSQQNMFILYGPYLYYVYLLGNVAVHCTE